MQGIFFSLKITIVHCNKGMYGKVSCFIFPHANHGKMGKKLTKSQPTLFSLKCQKLFASSFTDVIWTYFLEIHISGETKLPRLVEIFAFQFFPNFEPEVAACSSGGQYKA